MDAEITLVRQAGYAGRNLPISHTRISSIETMLEQLISEFTDEPKRLPVICEWTDVANYETRHVVVYRLLEHAGPERVRKSVNARQSLLPNPE